MGSKPEPNIARLVIWKSGANYRAVQVIPTVTGAPATLTCHGNDLVGTVMIGGPTKLVLRYNPTTGRLSYEAGPNAGVGKTDGDTASKVSDSTASASPVASP